MTKKANHPVRTTEKTLELIEVLDTDEGFRLSELEERLDMSKSGIHNHLSTLREHGYVEKEGDEYALSLKFLSLGGHVRSRSSLYRHGRAKIDQLADDTGMLANLATEENGRAVYLYQSRGQYAVSLDTHVGFRLRLHNVGIGKAILASLSRERVEEIVDQWGLPKATENTITDRDELHAELERVRERGVAFDDEARLEGLRCVAVPITDDEDDVKGAVSLSGPVSRFQGQYFRSELPERLRDAANIIELNITYT